MLVPMNDKCADQDIGDFICQHVSNLILSEGLKEFSWNIEGANISVEIIDNKHAEIYISKDIESDNLHDFRTASDYVVWKIGSPVPDIFKWAFSDEE